MNELPLHHAKGDVCLTRPKYRSSKKPKGVKVYTICDESKYLIVTQIPSLGAHEELIKLFGIYGKIEEYKMLKEYPCDAFCETMLIKYEKVQNARIAKIKLDDYNFYGGSLHVFYTPEHETIEDLREKLKERQSVVITKCKKYNKMKFGSLEYDLNRKKSECIRLKNTFNKKRQAGPLKSQESLVYGPQLPDKSIEETISVQPIQQRVHDEFQRRRKKLKL